ncbi:MAG TPA: MarC family protein [Acidobacteriota bacterium]|nr:MarC family protein [Acidobacteriota bacterium]
MIITIAVLLLSDQIHRLLGRNGENVLVRVMGLILAALAAEQMGYRDRNADILTRRMRRIFRRRRLKSIR